MNPKSIVVLSDSEKLENMYKERQDWWVRKGFMDAKIVELELKLGRR
jgi:hypothetical protein